MGLMKPKPQGNIPDCCIEAFIKGEARANHLLKYGQCQSCIATGNGAEIHFCTVECIPFLQSIGLDPLKLEFKKESKSEVQSARL